MFLFHILCHLQTYENYLWRSKSDTNILSYSMVKTYFKQLKGKAALVGLMFLVGGGIYSFTAPLWGYLTDKKVRLQNQVYKKLKNYDRIFKAISGCKKNCILFFVNLCIVHFYLISQNARFYFRAMLKQWLVLEIW